MSLVIVGGFLINIPFIPILEQTARNLFFHVPMWMAMYAMFLISLFHSIAYLRKASEEGIVVIRCFDIKLQYENGKQRQNI